MLLAFCLAIYQFFTQQNRYDTLSLITLPDMYQRGPVRSTGMAKKAVETLKAHNHLLEPQLAAGEKKPPVTCQSGKKSREWWEVHPESNSSSL